MMNDMPKTCKEGRDYTTVKVKDPLYIIPFLSSVTTTLLENYLWLLI